MKILVTGGTGFLGSHIVRALVSAGHEVIALRREKSSLDRCTDFAKQVIWLNHNAPDWIQQAIAEKPMAIIHSAWAGVTAAERADWKFQATNLALFTDLLQIADNVNLQHFIALGSQAEYGPINGRVDENHPCRPETAYGATKLACLALLEGFARQKGLAYVWLRLFSLYGPGEGEQWLIPSLIRQMKLGQSPQLSGCEQRYDYLHVHDLAAASAGGVAPAGKKRSVQPEFQCFTAFETSGATNQEPHRLPRRACIWRITLPFRPAHALEGDSTRFNQGFAFQPQITIIEGLHKLIAETPATK